MHNNKLIIFMHIPKTAGVTMRSILKKQYPSCLSLGNNFKDLSKISQYNTDGIDCLYGHFVFGIHHHISRPSTYITFLRNPIEQLISLYYFIRSKPGRHGYDKVINMSFEDWVEKVYKANPLTRYVSGNTNLNNAKENLTKYFSVVGITERFDESVFLIKKELGWKNIDPYVPRNVTPNRPTQDQFPKKLIDLIKIKNQQDMELYNYARQLFESKMQSLDPEDRKKLESFVKKLKRTQETYSRKNP